MNGSAQQVVVHHACQTEHIFEGWFLADIEAFVSSYEPDVIISTSSLHPIFFEAVPFFSEAGCPFPELSNGNPCLSCGGKGTRPRFHEPRRGVRLLGFANWMSEFCWHTFSVILNCHVLPAGFSPRLCVCSHPFHVAGTTDPTVPSPSEL